VTDLERHGHDIFHLARLEIHAGQPVGSGAHAARTIRLGGFLAGRQAFGHLVAADAEIDEVFVGIEAHVAVGGHAGRRGAANALVN
jgi:hypothetical protein